MSNIRTDKNERIKVTADGVVTGFFDVTDTSGANFVQPDGKTGTAVYTLHGEDIHKDVPANSPYREHISEDEPLSGFSREYRLDEKGLHITVSTDDERVSEFGVLLDLNMMGKFGTSYERQLLPTSPYTFSDGKLMYCIFTRPDGRCLAAAAETACDGWKIQYDIHSQFINSFSFLASFDASYGGSGRRDVTVCVAPAEDLAEAYRVIGEIYGLSYAVPIVSGGFSGEILLAVSDGVDSVIVREDGASERTVAVRNGVARFYLEKYGFAEAVPVNDGVCGIPAVVWNGVDMDDCYRKTSGKIDAIYHGDKNLCEGGCWTWSLLRYLRTHEDGRLTMAVLDDLRVITGETKPYTERRSIVPEAQNGFAPYHVYNSARIQEQFVGVSILLDAYRLFHVDDYLEHAVKALDELLENWTDSDGAIVAMGDREDYTTVTCPVIAVTDMAVFFKDRDPALCEKYRKAAVAMADHVVRRGFDFPTEGAKSQKVLMEDGSISCTALTVLYVAKNLENKPEYTDFAGRILKVHDAWRLSSPDARMFGSSMRWWETIWEGDATGPNIDSGHAWTIWRAEALFLYGELTGNAERLIDSWDAFITNFCKARADGQTYACYVPDYICGGGSDGVRKGQLNREMFERVERYRVAHAYPETPDYSLSRYAWVRAADTWMKTAALLDLNGVIVTLNCRLEGDRVVTAKGVGKLLVSASLAEKYSSDVEKTVL